MARTKSRPPQEKRRHPSASRVTEIEREPNPLNRWLKVLGPGLITGASDDDPSGIATYAIAGASLGFSCLWLALVTLPLMATTQFISAKIGMVSGTGIAGALKRDYPAWVVYPAVFGLVVANTINAGADLGAVAAAVNLFVSVPALACVLSVAVVLIALQVWGSYRLIADVFRWLTLALLAYIGAAFFAHPSLGAMAQGTFLPSITLSTAFISTLVAVLGTTISPYLWFWQSSQEVDEEREHGKRRLVQRKGATRAELKYKAWDVNAGMFLSNLVMYFIILTTAATLNKAGQTDINSATEAAQALRPLAGDAAKYLLALGLIGAGLLAVPVLTGSIGYATAESFGWNSSLDAAPGRAKRLYAVIFVATVVAVLFNLAGINPIKALYYTAIVNGMLSPPLLFLIMRLSTNPAVVGDKPNGRVTAVLGWTTTIVMSLAALALVALWVTGTS